MKIKKFVSATGRPMLYDLPITDAEKAACDLFDRTLEIIKEYEPKRMEVAQ